MYKIRTGVGVDHSGKSAEISLNELINAVEKARVINRSDKLKQEWILFGNSSSRKREDVQDRCMLAIDIDNTSNSMHEISSLLVNAGYNYIIYATLNHTFDAPRFRVIIPLVDSVDRDQYEYAVKSFIKVSGLNSITPLDDKKNAIDNKSFEPQQIMFIGCRNEDTYEYDYDVGMQFFKHKNVKLSNNKTKENKISNKTEEEKIVDALSYIPSDDRDIWIAVGMALYHGLGQGQDAFSIWDNWSKTSHKYKQKGMSKIWSGFNRDGSVRGLGTIYHYAEENGFINYSIDSDIELYVSDEFNRSIDSMVENWKKSKLEEQSEINEEIVLKSIEKSKKTDIEIEEEKLEIEKESGVRLPLPKKGILKDIYEYVRKKSIYFVPEAAIMTAISVVGCAASKTRESPTGTRTSLYSVILAPSSSGKNASATFIDDLIDADDLDSCNISLSSGFHSVSALGEILKTPKNPIIVVDEASALFSQLLAGDNKGSMAGTQQAMMAISSKQGLTYRGAQYSKANSSMNVEVKNATLTLFALNTKDDFLKHFTKDNARNGFAGRLLIATSNSFDVKANKNNYKDKVLMDNIVKFMTILTQKQNVNFYNPEAEASAEDNFEQNVFDIQTDHFSSENVESRYFEISENYRKTAKSLSEPYRSLLAKQPENLIKLAHIYAISMNVNDTVIDDDAITFGKACCDYFYNVQASSFQAFDEQSESSDNVVYILDKLRLFNGLVDFTSLLRKCRKFNKKKLDEVVRDITTMDYAIIENGKIKITQDGIDFLSKIR
jgi:hypothetical protein